MITRVSGIGKYFDKELKNKNKINKPLQLTLDSNIQYIINKELNKVTKLLTLRAAGC